MHSGNSGTHTWKENQGSVSHYKNPLQWQTIPVTDKLYYRYLILVNIVIRMEDEQLYSSRKWIYQFGEVMQLPGNYIIGKLIRKIFPHTLYFYLWFLTWSLSSALCALSPLAYCTFPTKLSETHPISGFYMHHRQRSLEGLPFLCSPESRNRVRRKFFIFFGHENNCGIGDLSCSRGQCQLMSPSCFPSFMNVCPMDVIFSLPSALTWPGKTYYSGDRQ